MGKSEALREAQYWFREVEQIVRWTREEAAREGFTMPANFANDDRWREAEAKIEMAAGEGDYIKTRDLSRAYIARAVQYCRTWLEKRKAKGASAK